LKKIIAIACGYLDGILGRLGTFEHRQPHIAAFCKTTAGRQIGIGASSPVLVTEDKA
jgi:rhamnosyltransferase